MDQIVLGFNERKALFTSSLGTDYLYINVLNQNATVVCVVTYLCNYLSWSSQHPTIAGMLIFIHLKANLYIKLFPLFYLE